MKVLFFIIAIAACSATFAQTDGQSWVRPIKPQPKTNSLSRPKVDQFHALPRLLPNARLLQTLPDGSEVYALPNSNMPCIVPDLSQYNYNMPVVQPPVDRTMPNLPVPLFNEPKVITDEQLKKLLEKYPSHK